jgi:hypothetical protein
MTFKLLVALAYYQGPALVMLVGSHAMRPQKPTLMLMTVPVSSCWRKSLDFRAASSPRLRSWVMAHVATHFATMSLFRCGEGDSFFSEFQ